MATGRKVEKAPPGKHSPRGTDMAAEEEQLGEELLRAAREEISHVAEFDYVIINKEFEEARRDLSAVVRAARTVK